MYNNIEEKKGDRWKDSQNKISHKIQGSSIGGVGKHLKCCYQLAPDKIEHCQVPHLQCQDRYVQYIMAVGTTSFEELKNAILELVECPVCLDTTRIPFKLCCFGHMTCSDCVENSLKCPTCKAPYIMENPIVMKQLIQLSSMDLCQYSSEGCPEAVELGDNHELYCGYRPMTCREPHCEEVVQVHKIKTHYRLAHKSEYINKSYQTFVRIDACDLIKEDFFDVCPLEMDNNMFWIVLRKDVKAEELRITLQVTPVGKLTQDYYARVTFDSKDCIYRYTLKALMTSNCMDKPGPIKDNQETNAEKLDQVEPNDNLEVLFCFRLPLAALVEGLDDYFRHSIEFEYFTKNIQ